MIREAVEAIFYGDYDSYEFEKNFISKVEDKEMKALLERVNDYRRYVENQISRSENEYDNIEDMLESIRVDEEHFWAYSSYIVSLLQIYFMYNEKG